MSKYEKKALAHAEEIGVTEYQVNGSTMEYWSFFGKSEGWYFIRYDLESDREIFRGANIPWDVRVSHPIPMFLRTDTGALTYNYNCG